MDSPRHSRDGMDPRNIGTEELHPKRSNGDRSKTNHRLSDEGDRNLEAGTDIRYSSIILSPSLLITSSLFLYSFILCSVFSRALMSSSGMGGWMIFKDSR